MLKLKIRNYLLEITIFLIGLILGLTITNWDFIESNAFIVLAITLFVSLVIHRVLKGNKAVKEYEDTLYHLIYGVTYDEYVNSEYIMFECFVYERLNEEFSPESLIIIQKFSPNDELAMICMMMYHPSGIYCIQLSMMTDNKDLTNIVLDNKVNVDNLKAIYDFDYKNIVIVPDTTDINNIDNVYHLEDFIEMVNSKVNVYSINDFNEVIHSINEQEKQFIDIDNDDNIF